MFTDSGEWVVMSNAYWRQRALLNTPYIFLNKKKYTNIKQNYHVKVRQDKPKEGKEPKGRH